MQPDSQPVTIVQISPDKAAVELSMIDVAVAAFGLTGAIMVAAIVAGISAGALFIWYPITQSDHPDRGAGPSAQFVQD